MNWILRWPQNSIVIIGVLAVLDLGLYWLSDRRGAAKRWKCPDSPMDLVKEGS